MKRVILAVTVFVMVFASCNKNEETTTKEVSKYISIDAGVETLTRATATEFEDGDKISVYAWTGVATEVTTPLIVDNSINTFEDETWSDGTQMLWKDMVTPHYFVATYPTQTISDFTAYEFTLTGVQADDDLLFATNTTGIKGEDATSVPLIFTHSQSKLIVKLAFRNQFGGTPTVTSVTTSAITKASVNFITKETTTKGTATSTVAIATVTANEKYESILVPQTINKITITIDGKDYIYNNSTGIVLVQGKTKTVNLIVGRDGIELGTVSITEWGAEDEIDGGEAQQQ